MIIGRTPFRISFFGGGTDYPLWYREHRGAVLSTTIDKYCYISCRPLPPFFEHKSRLVYSKVELVKDVSEFQHPAAREVIEYLGIKEGLEIHHDGDLPARSGIGSSSSFTVGLLNTLCALQGKSLSKEELARQSIFIEQELIKENVGSQDQTSVAFGGLNLIEFSPPVSGMDEIVVTPLNHLDNVPALESHLMLFYLGTSRISSEVAKHLLDSMPSHRHSLHTLYQMVWEGKSILENKNWDANAFGQLLHESWLIKRSLSPQISLEAIDSFYQTARKLGALGGKLLGAGGGGFFMLFAPPEKHAQIRAGLPDVLSVPFAFEQMGAQIIFGAPGANKDEKDVPSFNEEQYH